MTNYISTNTWFLNSEIKQILYKFLNPFGINKILEIGSYEGLSACNFSDNFMFNEDSSLVCVDPFDIKDTCSPLTNKTKIYFYENIAKSKKFMKCALHIKYSRDFYLQNTKTFNFIYIDGSHLVEDIFLDMTECLKILEKGGIMWLDDYLGGDRIQIKKVMDDFVENNKNSVKIIWKGYQLALQKL